jgi:3-deoxy-D-manno-octulosonic-acid transferase
MAFFLYQCLFFFCLPFAFVVLLWRKDTRKRFAHCCGFFSFENRKTLPTGKNLWFHAVSYGETRLILRFIQTGLENKRINGNIIFTTTIENALQLFQQEAAENFPQIPVYTCLYPLDWWPITKRFISFINPKILFLSETDLWPSALTCLHRMNIPVYLINGRISTPMTKFFLTLPGLAKPMLDSIRTAFVQTKNDTIAFRELKCQTRVVIAGNAKFDLIYKDNNRKIDLPQNLKKILLFGSFHKDEFPIAIRIKQKMSDNFSFVIAPRRMEEIKILIHLLKTAKMSCQLLSEAKTELNSDFLIIDSMGLLSLLYQYCELTIIGGSFDQTGGHNFMEAVLFKKPVFIGPFTRNIKNDTDEFAKRDLITRVQDEKQLLQKLIDYCHNPADYINKGIRAGNYLNKKRGILQKTWSEIPLIH